MPNNNAILFQPTGEVRPPKAGEWFVSTMFDGEIHLAHKDFPDTAHKQIVTRHEIPAEMGKKMMEVSQ